MKILWAIDPFAKEAKFQLTAGKAIQALTKKESAEIEFVTVVRPPEGISNPDDATRSLQPLLEAKLAKWAAALKWKQPPSLKILVQRGVYLRAEVDLLTEYARKSGASLIVASTHARKGMARFWLGSFAETLLLHSKIPLLLVNPAARVPTRYTKVLFPTDLSPESKEIFSKALEFFSTLAVEVTLYHRVEEYLDLAAAGMTPVPVVRKVMKRELDARKKLLAPWVQMAGAKGLKTKVVVDNAGNSLSDAILTRSKSSQTGFIAMGSHAGVLATFLLGSTARQVARAAVCPVWVVRG